MAAAAAVVLGMRPGDVERMEQISGSRNRHIHRYQKVAPTPPGFPRRPGMARKRPLA
jgi:16S rRNA (guanine527-N7)-methyltransferase